MRLRLLWLAAAMAFVAACKSSTSPSGGGHSTTISVASNFFSPTPDTIPAGQVTFTWVSGTHNVTWDTGPGTLPPNSSTITMTSGTYPATLQRGTYQYHCSFHVAQGMRGTIVVQ